MTLSASAVALLAQLEGGGGKGLVARFRGPILPFRDAQLSCCSLQRIRQGQADRNRIGLANKMHASKHGENNKMRGKQLLIASSSAVYFPRKQAQCQEGRAALVAYANVTYAMLTLSAVIDTVGPFGGRGRGNNPVTGLRAAPARPVRGHPPPPEQGFLGVRFETLSNF